jgi:hypothetical protein
LAFVDVKYKVVPAVTAMVVACVVTAADAVPEFVKPPPI